ncbi:1,3-beta-glucanosyltransferase gel4 [Drechslerella dactyloides]|uniref:1,3-beta-glucanosyltransferase n=1 Tax=Drechslerella dactyloides TaxID=74499 RepID=A0AAD6J2A5_DREDA|nr:1,3-beta-glucanosyltransferase gel4 [Drechslerella dactyloides]
MASRVAMVDAAAPLTIKGNKFFNSQTGDQFYIKGVAYQLRARTDPLVDKDQCALDAALMKTLGVNTIRVYQTDPHGNHDDCMRIFADAGIYLFVDLANFETGINEDNPYWSQTQLSSFAATLDAFARYENTVGFWIGNEVITKSVGARAVYFIAAAVADIKTHIKDKDYGKPVYIGYASTDNADTRPFVQNYLACDHPGFTGRAASIDFYGVNAYEWCNPYDTFETSGYQRLTGYLSAARYDIPAFFSEDGCNTNPPRLFEDMYAVYGQNMSDWWSGSIVYEWIQEANKYGLVTYGMVEDPSTAIGGDPYERYEVTIPEIWNIPNSLCRAGTPTPVSPDFENLKTVWSNVDLSTTNIALSA